jgi:hypothetical protein
VEYLANAEWPLFSGQFRAGRVGAALARGVDVECIITREDAPAHLVVHVSGALTQAQVPDLLQACGRTGTGMAVVDLADLVSADDLAVHSLRRLRANGVVLINASPHIQSKLGA